MDKYEISVLEELHRRSIWSSQKVCYGREIFFIFFWKKNSIFYARCLTVPKQNQKLETQISRWSTSKHQLHTLTDASSRKREMFE